MSERLTEQEIKSLNDAEERAVSADCGADFAHEPHLFRTPRGKVKACDGSITKRTTDERSEG